VRHRIYAPQPFLVGEFVDIAGDEFHHAVRVVRVKEGEEVELFDGRGNAVRGNVVAVERAQLRVRVDGEVPSRELSINLCLAMSIIQLDKFELVLQKATELGVRSFIPTVSERVEVRPERYRGKQERWGKIVFEAVKQSGRSAIPAIEEPAPLVEVVARSGVRIIFDADHESAPLPDSLAAATLLVGPEGGWSESELEIARGAGCLPQRLGSRRLRAETAAIVATAVISARCGDI